MQYVTIISIKYFKVKLTTNHRKGSIVISIAAQGLVSSNFVKTFGWRTPKRPMLVPLTTMSAHRPEKYVASVVEKKINITSLKSLHNFY